MSTTSVINPYASPAQPGGVILEARERGFPTFVSNLFWTRATLLMFAALACIYLVGTVTTSFEIELLSRISAQGDFTQEEADRSDAGQNAVIFAGLGLVPLTAISFCLWIYRAYRNLYALHPDLLEYSPGWAVGLYFVPIFNLFRPYQVMVEIWENSDPARLGNRSTGASATIVGWWWAFWLLEHVVGAVIRPLGRNADEAAELLVVSWAALIKHFINLPLALLAFTIVWIVSRNQILRHNKLN
jgi:hypothetical protein